MSKKMLAAFWGCGDSQIIDFAIERARLNRRERDTVRLILDECLSQEEAAEALNISTRLLQQQWHNAEKKLLAIPWVTAYAVDLINKQ